MTLIEALEFGCKESASIAASQRGLWPANSETWHPSDRPPRRQPRQEVL